MRTATKPAQSDFFDREQPPVSATAPLFTKQYPTFFRREDIHRDFVAVKRELQDRIPHAKLIKEDVDTAHARLQFDVSTASEPLLEKLLVRCGFVRVR